MAEKTDIPAVFPAGIGSYRMYVSEYERLRRRYSQLRSDGMRESASVTAYEAVCLHSQMRRIEKFISEQSDDPFLCCEENEDADAADGESESGKLVIFARYRYILGLSIEETAERMHVSRSTAYRIAAQTDRAIKCAR